MLRETAELTSPEVAMVHRGERVLLLHQVGVWSLFFVEKFGGILMDFWWVKKKVG